MKSAGKFFMIFQKKNRLPCFYYYIKKFFVSRHTMFGKNMLIVILAPNLSYFSFYEWFISMVANSFNPFRPILVIFFLHKNKQNSQKLMH